MVFIEALDSFLTAIEQLVNSHAEEFVVFQGPPEGGSGNHGIEGVPLI